MVDLSGLCLLKIIAFNLSFSKVDFENDRFIVFVIWQMDGDFER